MEEPLLTLSVPDAGVKIAPAADAPATHSSSPPAPVLPTSDVVVRLAFLAALALLSLWANYEASRGFDFEVVNAAAGTPAGRRFDLMFVSNGRASRAVLEASRAVEHALYPGAGADEEKKQVQRITLRLADGDVSAGVVVLRGGRGGDLLGENDFEIQVNSGVMLAADANEAMRAAVRRGMARVWLWDGKGEAPEALLDAMVEYLEGSGSLDGAAGRDPVASGSSTPSTVEGGEEKFCWPAAAQGRDAAGRFVQLCESKREGFVARLNQAMSGRWRPSMVEEALGSPPGWPCGTQSTSAWVGRVASPVGGGRAGGTAGNGYVTTKGWASG